MSVIDNQTSVKSSLGCGLFGCAGGLLLGLGGGGLLLVLAALIIAASSPVPTPVVVATSDLRLTVRENFLNKFIQTPTEDQTRVDILPGHQFRLTVDTTVSMLGISMPLQLTGLFELQLNNQAVEIHLLETKISDATLPPELTNSLNDTLPDINQELNKAVKDMAAILGAPLTFVDLGSDETSFWLEAREAP